MGFSDYFISGLAIAKPNTRWCEPWMWEARQNGTFKRKMITAAIFPAVGAIIVLILSSVGNNPGGIPAGAYAVMGMMFGLLISAFYLGKDLAPGSVKMGKKEIIRTKYSVAGSLQWVHWEKWPYSAIRQCRIIPQKKPKGYAILEITTHDGQCDKIFVSDIVDLTKLGQLIQSHGISVLVPGGVLPPGPKGNPAIKMVGIRMAIGVPFILVLVLFATMGGGEKGDKQDGNEQAVQAGAGRIGLTEEQIRASTQRAGGAERSIRDHFLDNKRPSQSAQPDDDDVWPSQRLRSGGDLPIGGHHPHSAPSRFGPRGRPSSGFRPRSVPRHVPSSNKPPKYETEIPDEEPEEPLVDPFAD